MKFEELKKALKMHEDNVECYCPYCHNIVKMIYDTDCYFDGEDESWYSYYTCSKCSHMFDCRNQEHYMIIGYNQVALEDE